jgi:hypothetical protein
MPSFAHLGNALTPLYSNLVWCCVCVCIVACALDAQPAADDHSGPSTVFVWFWECFVGVKDNSPPVKPTKLTMELVLREPALREYKPVRWLGEGSFGAVILATVVDTGEQVPSAVFRAGPRVRAA